MEKINAVYLQLQYILMNVKIGVGEGDTDVESNKQRQRASRAAQRQPLLKNLSGDRNYFSSNPF